MGFQRRKQSSCGGIRTRTLQILSLLPSAKLGYTAIKIKRELTIQGFVTTALPLSYIRYANDRIRTDDQLWDKKYLVFTPR